MTAPTELLGDSNHANPVSPRTTPHHLPRIRLLQKLDQLPALTALTGLPGSGKTSVAAHWARQRAEKGDSITWIDAADEEPPDLHAWLHDHFTGADHRTSCRLQAVATPDHYRTCLHTDLRATETRRRIVVIDRAEVLTATETLKALCELLRGATGLHLVICSRTRHPLAVAAQHQGLSVNLIDGNELRATPDEIPLLAKTWGHQTDIDVSRLHAQTGGWIQPTRLMLDALPHTPSVGNEAAKDYIRTIAISAVQDADVLTAAMRLALAESITPTHITEVAAAVPARQDGAAHTEDDLLTRLLNAGLLGSHPGEHDAWAIAPVLRGALASEYASRAPAESLAWHRRFAHALRDCGDSGRLGRAIGHARAARDWQFLIDLWNSAGLSLTHQYADDLVAAYKRIPHPVLAKHPLLGIPAAIARALEEHPRGVKTQQAVHHAFRAAGEPLLRKEVPDPDRPSNLHLQLLSTGIVIDRAEGRYERAITTAKRLDNELTQRERSNGHGPQPLRRAWLLHQWSRALLLSGDEEEALTLATKAFTSAQEDIHTVAANIAADIALIHAVGGSITGAEHWLNVHSRHDTTDQWMGEIAGLPAHIARALVALDRLDPDTAQAELDSTDDGNGQAEMWSFMVHATTQHALAHGDPFVALTAINGYEALNPHTARAAGIAPRIIGRCRADLYLALGEVNLAQRHLADIGPEVPWLQVPRARLHLISGDPVHALRVASASVWSPTTTLRDRIDLLMIKAAASEALGNTESADQSFSRASAIAEQLGILRPYLLIDSETRKTFVQRTGTVLDDDVLTRLDSTRPVYPKHAELIGLTERELAVLYELTRHKSWSDIANALVVAPSTVKKQILSIYAKLDVHDRDAALLRAARLGFLPEPGMPTAAAPTI